MLEAIYTGYVSVHLYEADNKRKRLNSWMVWSVQVIRCLASVADYTVMRHIWHAFCCPFFVDKTQPGDRSFAVAMASGV